MQFIWVLSSRTLIRPKFKCQPGLCFIWGLPKKDLLSSSPGGRYQDSASCGLLTEGLSLPWLLAGVCPHGTFPWQLTSPKLARESSTLEVSVFCKNIMEMTSHHFCHFFIHSKLVTRSGHPQREGITQGHGYQKAEVTGGCLTGAYHRDCCELCRTFLRTTLKFKILPSFVPSFSPALGVRPA